MFRGLWYFLRGGVKNIWRNKLMSAASVGIVAASLVLFGVFLLAEIDINSVLGSIEGQCEINVYISEDAGGSNLNRIYDELSKIQGIKEVRFLSKEERIELAKQTAYKDREYLIDDLTGDDNPLRDSYVLSADDIGMSGEIAAAAEKVQGVDEVINLQQMVDRIKTLSSGLRRTGGVIMIVLALIAMFIIINTIKLGLIYRGREISIMRYVGASDSYICGPFMVEGLILGIAGAVIAAIPVLWAYSVFASKAGALLGFGFISLPDVWHVWHILAVWFLAIGAGIGLIGSGISIRKYLKA